MKLRQVSGIARPLALDYRTNRWITLLTLVVLIVSGLWRVLLGQSWLAATAWSVTAALSVFLAWAIARELDPDAELAAFAAVGLTLPALAASGLGWMPLPDLAGLFLLMLAVRVLNRTTGVAATLPDTLGLLALGLWLGYQSSPVYLAAAVAALLVDGLIGPADRGRLALAAAAAAVGGLLITIGSPPDDFGGSPARAPLVVQALLLAALVLSALFTVTIRAAAQVHSLADDTADPLSPRRVRAGQLLALLAAVGILLGHGGAGLIALLPLWAAMAATGVYRLAAGR